MALWTRRSLEAPEEGRFSTQEFGTFSAQPPQMMRRAANSRWCVPGHIPLSKEMWKPRSSMMPPASFRVLRDERLAKRGGIPSYGLGGLFSRMGRAKPTAERIVTTRQGLEKGESHAGRKPQRIHGGLPSRHQRNRFQSWRYG